MADNLVIVESPAKAGTIEKYLGPQYQVVASLGHVRDLPASKLGVDVEQQFVPQYVIPPKARPNIKKLKEALKGKKVVYLATDLDREGEAIAWHVAEVLGVHGDSPVELHRITFDEITKTAIQNAVAHPRTLNYQLIDAQQARRVLDRLVGYTLSPVLWKKLYKGLSAGRVQSVALRLIVDREEEREKFQPVEYWSIEALLEPQAGGLITAKLVEYAGKKIEQLTITTGDEAYRMQAALIAAAYQVQKIERKPVRRRPQPPYTTASFQQDAVNRLGISAKSAMRAAQILYEAGYITYMRTDSVEMAAEAITAVRGYVQETYGQAYLPSKPNHYVTKTKQAQEAHEAIRPTDPAREAESFTGDAVTHKVYDLIRRRALASQMAEAQVEQTILTIGAGEGIFRATGQRIVFPGFLAVQPVKEDEPLLPAVQEGEVLTLHELQTNQHFTEPPPRYTEASLIKALEEYGIGRPSTYAPTIDTLQARHYIQVEQRRLAPEKIGRLVTELLREHFPEIVDVGFTATMEEQLDHIAQGESKYAEVLGTFWEPFHKTVETKEQEIAKVDMTEPSDALCPTCGAPMIVKTGRFGRFLACTRFPECKTTQPLQKDDPTHLICPRDGKELVWKRARRGRFLGCSGYPTCDFAVWKIEQFPAKIEELEKAGEAFSHKDAALEAFRSLPAPSEPSEQ